MFRPPVFAPLSVAQCQARAQATAPALPRRMAAFMYEGVLLFGVLFVTGVVYALAMNQRHAMHDRNGLMVALFLALAVYFIGFWHKHGQTLAMKTWHLKLVQANGLTPPPMQAALRFVASWLWFAPALLLSYLAHWHQTSQYAAMMLVWLAVYASLCLLLPRRQFLHDLLVGTRLIDTRNDSSSP